MAKLSTVESTNQSTQFKPHLDRDTAAKLNPFVGITCWEDTASNVRGGLEFLSTHPAGPERIRELERNIPRVEGLYEAARRG